MDKLNIINCIAGIFTVCVGVFTVILVSLFRPHPRLTVKAYVVNMLGSNIKQVCFSIVNKGNINIKVQAVGFIKNRIEKTGFFVKITKREDKIAKLENK